MATTYNVTIKKYNGTDWDAIHPKTTAENIISGTLADARIPVLDASKITSGTFNTARIPNLDTSKITNGTFNANRIPDLDASKIASGILDDARIPSLAASKITSGTFDAARIPDLDASKITSGTIDVARLPALAITDVVTNTTMATFLMLYKTNPSVMQEGDVLILTTDKKTYIHNGGTKGTAADFTLLETPTDVVTSVAGKTGVVTLTKGDVELGNVTNESKTTMFTSPTFTGTPISTTATKGANTTQIATTAFVQTAIGDYVPKTRTVNGKELSTNITITKDDVGLSDVLNVNATNPANIRENPSYRFVTDSEKSIWSGKVSSLEDLGVTVAASKINFLSGVTQDVQTSLDKKQTKIILTEDALLGGYAGVQSGDVAFVY